MEESNTLSSSKIDGGSVKGSGEPPRRGRRDHSSGLQSESRARIPPTASYGFIAGLRAWMPKPGSLDVGRVPDELDRRRQAWRAHPTMYGSGTLWKYAQTVGPAHLSAVTHPGAKAEIKSYAEL